LAEDSNLINILAEFTLALVLFTDASFAKMEVIERNLSVPSRLLLIGLPLTIILGFISAYYLFDTFTWVEAAILAIILAPTDAALGKAVVTNPKIPAKVRASLNVESGLNDGICVPFLLLCFAFAIESKVGIEVLTHGYFIRAIGIGLVVGLGITYAGIYLIRHFSGKGWIGTSSQKVIVISLIISMFSLTQFLGGSGFITCFVGGLLFGVFARRHKQKLVLATEGIGNTMALATWVVFGAVIVGRLYNNIELDIILYSLLSLTVIRMLPVFLVLTGLNINTKTRLFMGWFGPRGLASIVFAVMALNLDLPHQATITLVIVCTILFSILLHGLSAKVLIDRLFK
jgi:NhaP-type Na+/H+ or K+/H+ antiporter